MDVSAEARAEAENIRSIFSALMPSAATASKAAGGSSMLGRQRARPSPSTERLEATERGGSSSSTTKLQPATSSSTGASKRAAFIAAAASPVKGLSRSSRLRPPSRSKATAAALDGAAAVTLADGVERHPRLDNALEGLSGNLSSELVHYLQQALVKVKLHIAQRLSVLLGPRHPQVSLFCEGFDNQLKLFRVRCSGFSSLSDAFRAWRLLHARSRDESLRADWQSHQQELEGHRWQLRLLALRLDMATRHRVGARTALLLQRCLGKWHEFGLAAQAWRTTQLHLEAMNDRSAIGMSVLERVLSRQDSLKHGDLLSGCWAVWAVAALRGSRSAGMAWLLCYRCFNSWHQRFRVVIRRRQNAALQECGVNRRCMEQADALRSDAFAAWCRSVSEQRTDTLTRSLETTVLRVQELQRDLARTHQARRRQLGLVLERTESSAAVHRFFEAWVGYCRFGAYERELAEARERQLQAERRALHAEGRAADFERAARVGESAGQLSLAALFANAAEQLVCNCFSAWVCDVNAWRRSVHGMELASATHRAELARQHVGALRDALQTQCLQKHVQGELFVLKMACFMEWQRWCAAAQRERERTQGQERLAEMERQSFEIQQLAAGMELQLAEARALALAAEERACASEQRHGALDEKTRRRALLNLIRDIDIAVVRMWFAAWADHLQSLARSREADALSREMSEVRNRGEVFRQLQLSYVVDRLRHEERGQLLMWCYLHWRWSLHGERASRLEGVADQLRQKCERRLKQLCHLARYTDVSWLQVTHFEAWRRAREVSRLEVRAVGLEKRAAASERQLQTAAERHRRQLVGQLARTHMARLLRHFFDAFLRNCELQLHQREVSDVMRQARAEYGLRCDRMYLTLKQSSALAAKHRWWSLWCFGVSNSMALRQIQKADATAESVRRSWHHTCGFWQRKTDSIFKQQILAAWVTECILSRCAVRRQNADVSGALVSQACLLALRVNQKQEGLQRLAVVSQMRTLLRAWCGEASRQARERALRDACVGRLEQSCYACLVACWSAWVRMFQRLACERQLAEGRERVLAAARDRCWRISDEAMQLLDKAGLGGIKQACFAAWASYCVSLERATMLGKADPYAVAMAASLYARSPAEEACSERGLTTIHRLVDFGNLQSCFSSWCTYRMQVRHEHDVTRLGESCHAVEQRCHAAEASAAQLQSQLSEVQNSTAETRQSLRSLVSLRSRQVAGCFIACDELVLQHRCFGCWRSSTSAAQHALELGACSRKVADVEENRRTAIATSHQQLTHVLLQGDAFRHQSYIFTAWYREWEAARLRRIDHALADQEAMSERQRDVRCSRVAAHLHRLTTAKSLAMHFFSWVRVKREKARGQLYAALSREGARLITLSVFDVWKARWLEHAYARQRHVLECHLASVQESLVSAVAGREQFALEGVAKARRSRWCRTVWLRWRQLTICSRFDRVRHLQLLALTAGESAHALLLACLRAWAAALQASQAEVRFAQVQLLCEDWQQRWQSHRQGLHRQVTLLLRRTEGHSLRFVLAAWSLVRREVGANASAQAARRRQVSLALRWGTEKTVLRACFSAWFEACQQTRQHKERQYAAAESATRQQQLLALSCLWQQKHSQVFVRQCLECWATSCRLSREDLLHKACMQSSQQKERLRGLRIAEGLATSSTTLARRCTLDLCWQAWFGYAHGAKQLKERVGAGLLRQHGRTCLAACVQQWSLLVKEVKRQQLAVQSEVTSQHQLLDHLQRQAKEHDWKRQKVLCACELGVVKMLKHQHFSKWADSLRISRTEAHAVGRAEGAWCMSAERSLKSICYLCWSMLVRSGQRARLLHQGAEELAQRTLLLSLVRCDKIASAWRRNAELALQQAVMAAWSALAYGQRSRSWAAYRFELLSTSEALLAVLLAWAKVTRSRVYGRQALTFGLASVTDLAASTVALRCLQQWRNLVLHRHHQRQMMRRHQVALFMFVQSASRRLVRHIFGGWSQLAVTRKHKMVAFSRIALASEGAAAARALSLIVHTWRSWTREDWWRRRIARFEGAELACALVQLKAVLGRVLQLWAYEARWHSRRREVLLSAVLCAGKKGGRRLLTTCWCCWRVAAEKRRTRSSSANYDRRLAAVSQGLTGGQMSRLLIVCLHSWKAATSEARFERSLDATGVHVQQHCERFSSTLRSLASSQDRVLRRAVFCTWRWVAFHSWCRRRSLSHGQQLFLERSASGIQVLLHSWRLLARHGALLRSTTGEQGRLALWDQVFLLRRAVFCAWRWQAFHAACRRRTLSNGHLVVSERAAHDVEVCLHAWRLQARHRALMRRATGKAQHRPQGEELGLRRAVFCTWAFRSRDRRRALRHEHQLFLRQAAYGLQVVFHTWRLRVRHRGALWFCAEGKQQRSQGEEVVLQRAVFCTWASHSRCQRRVLSRGQLLFLRCAANGLQVFVNSWRLFAQHEALLRGATAEQQRLQQLQLQDASRSGGVRFLRAMLSSSDGALKRSSLQQWFAVVAVVRQRRFDVMQTFLRGDRRESAVCLLIVFRSWQHCVARRLLSALADSRAEAADAALLARQRRFLRAMLSSSDGALKRSSLQQWFAVVAVVRQRRFDVMQTFLRGDRRESAVCLLIVFRSWQHCVARRLLSALADSRAEAADAALLARQRRWCMQQCWRAWRSEAWRRQRSRGALSMLLRHQTMAATVFCFRAWQRELVVQRASLERSQYEQLLHCQGQQQSDVVQLAWRKAVFGGSRASFRAWRGHVQASKARSSLLSNAALAVAVAYTSRDTFVCWRVWRDLALKTKEERVMRAAVMAVERDLLLHHAYGYRKVERTVTWMVIRTLCFSCFQAWAATFHSCRRQHLRLHACSALLVLSQVQVCLTKTLAEWRRVAEQTKHTERLLLDGACAEQRLRASYQGRYRDLVERSLGDRAALGSSRVLRRAVFSGWLLVAQGEQERRLVHQEASDMLASARNAGLSGGRGTGFCITDELLLPTVVSAWFVATKQGACSRRAMAARTSEARFSVGYSAALTWSRRSVSAFRHCCLAVWAMVAKLGRVRRVVNHRALPPLGLTATGDSAEAECFLAWALLVLRTRAESITIASRSTEARQSARYMAAMLAWSHSSAGCLRRHCLAAWSCLAQEGAHRRRARDLKVACSTLLGESWLWRCMRAWCSVARAAARRTRSARLVEGTLLGFLSNDVAAAVFVAWREVAVREVAARSAHLERRYMEARFSRTQEVCLQAVRGLLGARDDRTLTADGFQQWRAIVQLRRRRDTVWRLLGSQVEASSAAGMQLLCMRLWHMALQATTKTRRLRAEAAASEQGLQLTLKTRYRSARIAFELGRTKSLARLAFSCWCAAARWVCVRGSWASGAWKAALCSSKRWSFVTWRAAVAFAVVRRAGLDSVTASSISCRTGLSTLLALPLVAWRTLAQEQRRCRDAMAQSAARHDGVVSTLRMQLQHTAQAMLRRWAIGDAHQCSRSVFAAWRQAADAAGSERLAEAAHARSQHAAELMMRQWLCSDAQALLSTTLLLWRRATESETLRRLRQAAERSAHQATALLAQKWLVGESSALVASSFGAWRLLRESALCEKEAAMQQRAADGLQAQMSRLALRFMQHNEGSQASMLLTSAFWSWMKDCDDARRVRTADGREQERYVQMAHAQRLQRRVLQQCFSGDATLLLSLCTRTWHQQAQASGLRRLQSNAALRCAASMIQSHKEGLLAFGLFAWRRFVEVFSKRQQQLGTVLAFSKDSKSQALTAVLVKVCVQAWAAAAAASVSAALHASQRSMAKSTRQAVCRFWEEYLAMQGHQRTLQTAVLVWALETATLQREDLARVLASLRGAAATARQTAVRSRMEHVLMPLLSATFGAWKEMAKTVRGARLAEASSQRVDTSWQSGADAQLRRLCLRAWAALAEGNVQAQTARFALYGRVLQAWARGSGARMKAVCFGAWVRRYDEAKKTEGVRQTVLRYCAQCGSESLVRVALVAWKNLVTDGSTGHGNFETMLLESAERHRRLALAFLPVLGRAQREAAQQRHWREMEQDQLPQEHHSALVEALVQGRRCATVIHQLQGISAMLAQQGRDASQVRAAAVAAGEAALRMSGIATTSPAWAEALRGREEVEHLGRMAGQLADTLVPRLRQAEAMQGDVVAAIEAVTEAGIKTPAGHGGGMREASPMSRLLRLGAGPSSPQLPVAQRAPQRQLSIMSDHFSDCADSPARLVDGRAEERLALAMSQGDQPRTPQQRRSPSPIPGSRPPLMGYQQRQSSPPPRLALQQGGTATTPPRLRRPTPVSSSTGGFDSLASGRRLQLPAPRSCDSEAPLRPGGGFAALANAALPGLPGLQQAFGDAALLPSASAGKYAAAAGEEDITGVRHALGSIVSDLHRHIEERRAAIYEERHAGPLALPSTLPHSLEPMA
eukprot:TRINITY_DN17228_c0_g1_i7.p1 TRINITY_DN17228_c0_g1~~TRINITY_DN17228_c0_g1_i7.p1  ORF type:complete len:4391 (+),score=862.63 TRINITY_DN17228_c0_g1_i7:221-13393(+)